MADPNDAPPPERLIARITLTADRDYLPAVLAFLREAATRLGLGEADVVSVARVTEEVCLNVVEHGFEPGVEATFDVALMRRPGQLVVVVEDRGLPFDWSRLRSRDASPPPATPASVDAVRFSNLGVQGNRVEIVKHLPFDHIETYLASGKASPAPTSTEAAAVPVTVRAMTPADAIGVARCTYAVYGYSVPDDYLYVPDRICEMLHGGLLDVCVGTTPDGEIVSCLTREVARPGAPVGYLGEGMVDPRFRGHRLLEQMLVFLQRRSAEQGMLGLYAEAVTVHPFSQKSNLAIGFTETGIQLADEAPTVVFKRIDGAAANTRTATLLTFLKTSEGPRRSVYLPARHQSMIQRIYERGRFARTVETAAAAAPTGAAAVSVEVFPKWSEAALRVVTYGADLVDVVRVRLRELLLRRIDWICLDLPLSHPGARHLSERIEALGFFFAGVIPDLVGDDVLRLQYLNEVEADLASVHLASDFGKELFAYVVEAMRAQT